MCGMTDRKRPATQFDSLEAERARRFAALDRIGEVFKDVPAEELEAEVSKALSVIRERS
jgi:hypothetical protein